MSRRRSRTTLSQGLFDLIALLPWWAGLAMAAGTFFAMRALTAIPVDATLQTPLPDAFADALLKIFAIAGMYLLPMICVMAAFASAFRRYTRRRLLDQAAIDDATRVVRDIGWADFEKLVGELLRRQGYTVREIGGGGADGGVDLVAIRDGERHLVQCKQWRAHRVGVTVVRELYGAMAATGAAGGFVVTTGRFTEAAQLFVQGRNIVLIDGEALDGAIRRLRRPTASIESARAVAPAAAVGRRHLRREPTLTLR